MLKDIKNVMGSKRTHNIDFSQPYGLLIDAVSGKKYEISSTKKVSYFNTINSHNAC